MGEITGERKMSFYINKCKPFDLKRALAGDKVVTREGLVVNEIHHFKSVSSMYDVLVSVNGSVYACTKEGLYIFPEETRFDLFMAPRTKRFEAWVSVYQTGFGGVTWNNEYDASVGMDCIKTIKIETEIEI